MMVIIMDLSLNLLWKLIDMTHIILDIYQKQHGNVEKYSDF